MLLVSKAFEEDEKDKLYQHWLVLQPNDGKLITPFQVWYDSLKEKIEKQEVRTNKTTDEILAMTEDIRRRAMKK